jgi:hypothetical protein
MRCSPLHSLRLLLLAATLLAPARGLAAMDAEAELGYVDYRSEAHGAKASASGFAQRYALMYSTNGAFSGGTDGYYKASLGYEWGSMQTKIAMPGSDQSLSVSDGHAVYNGELRYRPRNLPLFLKLYSRDLHRMNFNRNADAFVLGGDPVLHPDLPVDLVGGGSRITNGATLLLGFGESTVSSGLTGSVFDDLPMLNVNYYDLMVRDLESLTPRHSTQRNLRVSLRKGGNYLHYFLTRDDDFLLPSASSSEKRYMVGNIDSTLNRTWIDLTNWIKVSVDGAYIRSTGPLYSAPTRYDVRVFGQLARNTWNASLYSSLSRSVYSDHVSYESRNPLYANGTLGSSADWQSNIRYEVRKDVGINNLLYYRSDAMAAMRLNTFKRSQFTLAPRLMVESVEVNNVKGLILDLNLESASTRRYSDALSLIGSYDVRWEKYEGGADSMSIVHTVDGRAIYAPSGAFKAELRQQLSAAGGERQDLGQEAFLQSSIGGGTSSNQLTKPQGGYLLSATSARGDWNITPRFSVAAMLDEVVQQVDGIGVESSTGIRSSVRYTGADIRIDGALQYARIDKTDQGSTDLSATANITYTPSQVVYSALRLRLHTIDYDSGSTDTDVMVRQELNYAYFPGSGMRRKLLDLSEALIHETNRGFTRTSLLVGTKYYPLQRLYLALDGRYTLRHAPENDSEFAGSGEIGVVYSKLQASLNYSYGRRTGADSRVEKRLAANVRKQF